MAAKIILSCAPNSHPFEERTLTLEKAVKVGRGSKTVDKLKPNENNAIFSCKVLSLNHAIIWFANGEFFVQDIKSSNGTFVNNERLSESGEQSGPTKIYSGDTLQFGVNVEDLNKKMVYSCIIANIKCYLPDGVECRDRIKSNVVLLPNCISYEDLLELKFYLQEANRREQILEDKLEALQTVLNNIRESTENNFEVFKAEDALLSRVDMLESQLEVYTNNENKDELKEKLKRLHDEKLCYQQTAKSYLQKSLEEKIEVIKKYEEVKNSLGNSEILTNYLNEELAKSQTEIQVVTKKLIEKIAENERSQMLIYDVEKRHEIEVNKLKNENEELLQKLIDSSNSMSSGITVINDGLAEHSIAGENLNNDENTNIENKFEISMESNEQLKHSVVKLLPDRTSIELLTSRKEFLHSQLEEKAKKMIKIQENYIDYMLEWQSLEKECNKLEGNLKEIIGQKKDFSENFTVFGKGDMGNIHFENNDPSINETCDSLNEFTKKKIVCDQHLRDLKEEFVQIKTSLNLLIENYKIAKEEFATFQVVNSNQMTNETGVHPYGYFTAVTEIINQFKEGNKLDGSHFNENLVNSESEYRRLLLELQITQKDCLLSKRVICLMEEEITKLLTQCQQLQKEKDLLVENQEKDVNILNEKEELLNKIDLLQESANALARRNLGNEEPTYTVREPMNVKEEWDVSCYLAFTVVVTIFCVILATFIWPSS